MSNNNRIVLLLGPNLTHKNTLSTFINSDLNLIGACIADKSGIKNDVLLLKRLIGREGFIKTLLKIVERLLYLLLNSRSDKKIFYDLFNKQKINESISNWKGEIKHTNDYGNKRIIKWLKEIKPDIIVIHTPYWVNKEIRKIVNGQVIGGHPGITPHYRGVHSPFWAIYNMEPHLVGFSVFLVDQGVDSGDVLLQGRVEIKKNDSYKSLSWKGMIEIAKAQKKILENGKLEDKAVSHKYIPENSNYSHPTVFEYLKYRKMQSYVR